MAFAYLLGAAHFFRFEADGTLLFVADFSGAADLFYVFFAVALFALAGIDACCDVYLSVSLSVYQNQNHLK